jgi:hypothetical protein
MVLKLIFTVLPYLRKRIWQKNSSLFRSRTLVRPIGFEKKNNIRVSFMTKTLFISCVARMASLLGTAASSLLQDTLNLLNSNPSTGQKFSSELFKSYINNKEACLSGLMIR